MWARAPRGHSYLTAPCWGGILTLGFASMFSRRSHSSLRVYLAFPVMASIEPLLICCLMAQINRKNGSPTVSWGKGEKSMSANRSWWQHRWGRLCRDPGVANPLMSLALQPRTVLRPNAPGCLQHLFSEPLRGCPETLGLGPHGNAGRNADIAAGGNHVQFSGGGMSCDCQPPCTPSNFTTSSAGCEPPPKGYASILYHGQRLSHCSEGWGTSIAVPMGTRVHNAQQQYKSTLINMGN